MYTPPSNIAIKSTKLFQSLFTRFGFKLRITGKPVGLRLSRIHAQADKRTICERVLLQPAPVNESEDYCINKTLQKASGWVKNADHCRLLHWIMGRLPWT